MKYSTMFNHMKTAFIIPSAIQDTQESQLVLQTIQHIQTIAKEAGLAVVSYADKAIAPELQAPLLNEVSFIATYQRDTKVQDLLRTLSPDQAKALSHIAALTWFFSVCATDHIFKQPTQVIVMEPGMPLSTDVFAQIQATPQDKFIFAPPSDSSLSSTQTGGITLKLNTHVWAFSSEQIPSLVDILNKSVHYTYERLTKGGDVDLSHTLFKFIDSSQIFFLRSLNRS